MDLFNVSYEALLLMLQRFFAHTEETGLVTTLPAGPGYPARTAGPSCELFYETDCVLPHRQAAWILLAERLRQAAGFCEPGAPCAPADRGRPGRRPVQPARHRPLPRGPPARPRRQVRTPGSGADRSRPPDPRRRFFKTGQSFTGHSSDLLSNLGDLIRSVYPV
jgi:hypothetical protein